MPAGTGLSLGCQSYALLARYHTCFKPACNVSMLCIETYAHSIDSHGPGQAAKHPCVYSHIPICFEHWRSIVYAAPKMHATYW